MYDVMRLNKYIQSLNRMPIIKCDCGKDILLVPDLKAMDKAILNHIHEHLKRKIATEERYFKQNNLETDLIQKILAEASQIGS